MIAKKHPFPDEGDGEQTRKVDSMSELVAGMLLDEHDAAPSDPSPSSLSAVSAIRPSAYPRPSSALQEQPRRSRLTRAIPIALVIALVLVFLLAALLLSR